VGKSDKIDRKTASELCTCGCILAKHYMDFQPGKSDCSTCDNCRGFVGTGRFDSSKLSRGKTQKKSDKEFHRRVVASMATKRRARKRAALKFAKESGWTIIDSKGKVLSKPLTKTSK
jgi:hypothetical protein